LLHWLYNSKLVSGPSDQTLKLFVDQAIFGDPAQSYTPKCSPPNNERWWHKAVVFLLKSVAGIKWFSSSIIWKKRSRAHLMHLTCHLYITFVLCYVYIMFHYKEDW